MSSTGFDIRKPSTPGARPVIVRVIPKPAVIAISQVIPAALIPWQSSTPRPNLWSSFRLPKLSPRVGVHTQTVIIAIVAAISSFGLSLATGQVWAHINAPSSVGSSIASAEPLANASVRNEQPAGLAVTTTPTTLAFNPVVITDPNAIYLPEEKMDVPDPLTERKAFLTTYLQSKHSPLADHVDALSEQTQWKLIIAIADSESSYCKHKALNNCWGVGGAWNLKAYDNYDQAIADVNRLLEQKYIAAGLTSPNTIEGKWVGHPNANWETAANQVMDDLKDVQ